MEYKRLPEDRLVLLLTLACNMQCPHCLREFNRSPHMPLDMAFRAIDEGAALGFPDVHLTGGEPGLHPDFRAICEYAVSKRVVPFVTTNGSIHAKYAFLSSPEMRTRKMQPGIRISLDGPSAEVHDVQRKAGSFDKAVASFHQFVSEGLEIKLHMCLSKLNLSSLPRMLEFVNELKPKHLTIGAVIPTGEDNKDIVLTPQEKQEAIRCILDYTAAQPEGVPVRTAASLRNGTGPVFCSTLAHKRSTTTLNPYGMWSFCCDTGLDGDLSIGSFPEVSVAKAFKRSHEIANELVAYRLEYYKSHSFIEPWFDSCEFCNKVLGYRALESVSTRRRVIPITQK